MISKRDISKMVRRIVRRQRGLRDHQIIHPRREWATGLTVGILALIAGATWSSLTYNVISERDIESVDPTEVEQVVYQENLVDAALNKFRERKESYEARLKLAETIEPVVEVKPVTEEEPETTNENETPISDDEEVPETVTETSEENVASVEEASEVSE